MTVKELIEKLEEYPEETLVWIKSNEWDGFDELQDGDINLDSDDENNLLLGIDE